MKKEVKISVIDWAMIFYYVTIGIPQVLLKLLHTKSILFSILFGVAVYLFLKHIHDLPYQIATILLTVWILISRFRLALLICECFKIHIILKIPIFFIVFIVTTYLGFRNVFGDNPLTKLGILFNRMISDWQKTNETESQTSSRDEYEEERKTESNYRKESYTNRQSENSGYQKQCVHNEYKEAAERFFENCKTEEDRKAVYRNLMKIYHPDQPQGNAELCKAITDVYVSR